MGCDKTACSERVTALEMENTHLRRELFELRERVRRQADGVLDADGVPIREGDTVRFDGDEWHVSRIGSEFMPDHVQLRNESKMTYVWPAQITHALPDSWERLEEDAAQGVCEYAGAEPYGGFDAHDCDTCRFFKGHGKAPCEQQMAHDLVSRAKRLAGVER